MINFNAHLDVLGYKVKDKITGFSGVATSVTFDLYGCIQVLINPGLDTDGKFKESNWFDENRIELKSTKRVMNPPFLQIKPKLKKDKGPAEKPSFYKP